MATTAGQMLEDWVLLPQTMGKLMTSIKRCRLNLYQGIVTFSRLDAVVVLNLFHFPALIT